MTLCPRGHPSSDEEFCDQCGARMTPPGETAMPAGTTEQGPTQPAEGDAEPEVCPVCDNPRVARYCEECAYDFLTGTPSGGPVTPGAFTAAAATTQPLARETTDVLGVGEADAAARLRVAAARDARKAASSWVAVVAADRAYFDRVVAEGGPDAAGVVFPPYCPERPVPLVGQEIRIGRHSRARDVRPEIDLGQPPKDPGVSHLHAVLLAQPGGGWTLVDPDSANGTLLNGSPLETNVPVPVGDGDRIHLGAWTVITLCERGREGGA